MKANLSPPIPAARPFLKWAGGKQALVSTLLERFPRDFDSYFEPFLGGGSVLLALSPSKAVASDRNGWLIDAWQLVRDRPDEVLEELCSLPNTREDYLRLRSLEPQSLAPVRRAALLVYLNKTGFRGLFRVNRLGRFNVPYGAYSRRYANPEQWRLLSVALAHVEFRRADFEESLSVARSGDFAYLDPPYWPLGGSADFARYTPEQFRVADHERLACCVRELDRRGVRFALTNSDTDQVRQLYRGFRIEPLKARREINLKSRARDARELLIRNE